LAEEIEKELGGRDYDLEMEGKIEEIVEKATFLVLM